MEITRRDFMKGVGGLIGLSYLGLGERGDCRREVGWSEKVEDEARLRNEVGDLMKEKRTRIYCYGNIEGSKLYHSENVIYRDVSIEFLSRIKESLFLIKMNPYVLFRVVPMLS